METDRKTETIRPFPNYLTNVNLRPLNTPTADIQVIHYQPNIIHS